MLSNCDEVLLVDNEGRAGMVRMNAVKLPILNVAWLAVPLYRTYNLCSVRLRWLLGSEGVGR